MSQPTDWNYVWNVVRSILETLYFLAGIGIFFAAKYAAQQVHIASGQLKIAADQLKATHEIADANRKRESVRLAAVQCRLNADEVVPAVDKLLLKYAAEKCTFLTVVPPGAVPFVVDKGELRLNNYDANRIPPEWPKVSAEAVNFLNKAESFAIPFAAGVADDDIGFQETAAGFCTNISVLMPAIYYLRTTQGARYRSVLMLFWVWQNRTAASALTPAVLKGIQDVIDSANNNRIAPI